MFGTPYLTLLFHRPLLPASNWSNFLLDWCSHCNSVVQSGGHLSEQVPALMSRSTHFVILCFHTYCWLFFIFICLFILLLFLLSNIFDLIDLNYNPMIILLLNYNHWFNVPWVQQPYHGLWSPASSLCPLEWKKIYSWCMLFLEMMCAGPVGSIWESEWCWM